MQDARHDFGVPGTRDKRVEKKRKITGDRGCCMKRNYSIKENV